MSRQRAARIDPSASSRIRIVERTYRRIRCPLQTYSRARNSSQSNGPVTGTERQLIYRLNPLLWRESGEVPQVCRVRATENTCSAIKGPRIYLKIA
jgi:hypothetical protein